MEVSVKKWGNSLGLRIPQAMANQINIQDGSKINLEVFKNKIVITPVASEEYHLNDLLALMNDSNLHSEIPTAESQGNEVW